MKRRISAHILRYRRELSALCAALAVLLLASTIHPQHERRIQIVVASHNVGAGVAITKDDITEKEVPQSVTWDGAVTEASQVIGRTCSHSLMSQQIISTSDFIGTSALSGLDVNTSAISIPWQGDSSFLQPGFHVDVYARQSSGASLVARNALILAIPATKSSGMFSGNNRENQSLLVAVNSDQVESIAAQPLGTTFTVALKAMN